MALLFLYLEAARAEPRVFTNSKGQEMIAELVSAKDDHVKLRRDGKIFKTRISVFSQEDQDYIRRWIKENPPKVDYNFAIEVDKKKLERKLQDMGYKKTKSNAWVYRVTLTNRSRDTADGLSLKYRAFKEDLVDGAYIRSSPQTEIKEDTIALPKMKYNHTALLTTDSFLLEMVHYDYASRRTEDSLEGIMLRVIDAAGNVVAEHREGSSAIKRRSWDEKKPGEAGEKAVIVNPLSN